MSWGDEKEAEDCPCTQKRPQDRLHQSTCPPRPSQNAHTLPAAGPAKSDRPPPGPRRPHSNRIQTRTKALGPRSMAADTGSRRRRATPRGQDSQLPLHFIATLPGGLRFPRHLSLWGAFVALPLHAHPASRPLSCRCSAGAPLGAPQSLRQVGESWESGGRAGPGPASGRWVLRGPANVAVGGACSGLLWGRTAVGARDRGLGHPAITCSVTPEKSPLPSGPQFPSL